MKPLDLDGYRELVGIDAPLAPPEPATASEEGRGTYVDDLLVHLLEEHVERWMSDHPGAIDLVVFNVFGREDLEAYERAIGEC